MKEKKDYNIEPPMCCHQDLECIHQIGTESVVYKKGKRCGILTDTEFKRKNGTRYMCPFYK